MTHDVYTVVIDPAPVIEVQVNHAPGAQGQPGVSPHWLSGTGAPSGGLGIVGDWYLDTEDPGNGDVYEKTGESTWTLRTNITGPSGGESGESAYEIAVNNGFVGTEQEWLDSLVGPSGEDGQDAVSVLPFVTQNLSGGTYVLDPEVGVDYSLTLTASSNLDLAECPEGTMLYVEVKQDGTGGRALGLPAEWLRVGSVDLHTLPGSLDILCIWVTPTGTMVKQVTDLAGIEPAWTPNSLSNPIAWYNAASLAGDANDPVTSWANTWAERDLGPNTSFPPPTLQVVNGINVANFNAANEETLYTVIQGGGATIGWAGGHRNQPVTYALVIKATGATPSGTIPILSSNSPSATDRDHQLFVHNSAVGAWSINAGTTLNGGGNIPSTFMTVIARFNGNNSLVRVNGSDTSGAAGAEPTSGMRVGRNIANTRNGTFQLAEMIVVNSAVSGQDLLNLEAYLNSKRDALNGA